MKKILLSIALLAATTGAALQPAAAQKNENRMSIRVAGYEVALEGKQQRRNTRNGWREWTYQGHIGTLEAGFNNFRTWGDSYWAYSPEENCFMELDRASSLHITVNAATFSAGFARNWIGISMALGLSYDQYALDTPVAFEKVGRKLYTYTPDAPLKSSKMRSLSLHVPLVLEIKWPGPRQGAKLTAPPNGQWGRMRYGSGRDGRGTTANGDLPRINFRAPIPTFWSSG